MAVQLKKYYGLVKKMGLKCGLLLLAVVGILGLWADWAGAKVFTTDNLIKNPDAENGTNDWVKEPVADTDFHTYSGVTGKLSPHKGGALFNVGGYHIDNQLTGVVYQEIDISKYVDEAINNEVKLTFKGWFTDDDDRDDTKIEIPEISFSKNVSTNNYTWECATITDAVVATGTKKIKIKMKASNNQGSHSDYFDGYFDDLSLTLTYERPVGELEVTTSDWDYEFGNIYIPKNATTKEYNQKKFSFKLKNIGDTDSVTNWQFERNTDKANIVRWDKESGDLKGGESETVEVYVEPAATGNLEDAFWIHYDDVKWKYYLKVSASVYDTTKISYAGPGMGTNNKVNVGLNGSVNFDVNKSGGPFNPDAAFGGYFWKKSAKLNVDEQNELMPNDFDVTTNHVKTYSFSDPGEYTLYCAAKETIGSKQIVGDLLEITVRVWKLPKVSDTPETTSSWYADSKKYVGVKGQSVYLKATGTTGANGDSSEKVAKFIWDFDNDWDTIEKEQTAGQSVSYTWSTAQLNARIRCKAVTNYGIQSEEQYFDLKIYEPVKVDTQGPYTGRPEKPVAMKCSFNSISYPGAGSIQYSWSASNGSRISINDTGDKVEYKWNYNGRYNIEAKVTVTTEEGLVLNGNSSSYVTIDAGKPTAMPGGPYKGGIFGGNFSPIQFEGNHPDFVEYADIGHIDTWKWSFERGGSADIWNPTRAFEKAGEYVATLKVRSEYGKLSDLKEAHIEVIDGKVAGYVKAADLRTPVGSVTLSLTSNHVDRNVLRRIAKDDPTIEAVDSEIGVILQAVTDNKGYYEFSHLPLGNYNIRASKGKGDEAHEFEKSIINTELTLDGPNQLAVDFVDLTVYPVGGRVVYSLQKNGQDVLVEGVSISAQSPGVFGAAQANPTQKSLSATGVNYSMPLLAGKYLLLAQKDNNDVRIKEDTPKYDKNTQLVTIEAARTDVDFIDYTTRKLTVFVVDSGGYKIASQSVTISGDNGQAEGMSDEGDGKLAASLNPGKYTVKVPGALPEEKEVDITYADQAVNMIIPVKIDLSVGPMPKLVDGAFLDFLIKDCGIKLEEIDTIEGYMIYLPSPNSIGHTFTVVPTAKGHPVGSFTLYVRDEVSMLTEDPPGEQTMRCDDKEYEYMMIAGLPKITTDDLPLAAPKKITFWVKKDGYLDSDKVTIEVTVLGDISKGGMGDIIALPSINYLVLHDPPGDGSYSYIDDSLTVKSFMWNTHLEIGMDRKTVPVYPEMWSGERWIKGNMWNNSWIGEMTGNKDKFQDLEGKGILSSKEGADIGLVVWPFLTDAAIEYGLSAIAAGVYKCQDKIIEQFEKKAPVAAASTALAGGAAGVAAAAAGDAVQSVSTAAQIITSIIYLGAWAGKAAGIAAGPGIQYDVTPTRHLETPSGDELPDQIGPGKGDVYYGEGLALGLQSKYRLGIKKDSKEKWQPFTEEIITYELLKRTNQYIYTAAEIANIVDDLNKKIGTITTEMKKIEAKEGSLTSTYKDKEKMKGNMETTKTRWDNLLKKNLAYKWQEDYASNGKTFEQFLGSEGTTLKVGERLIFNAGPTFDYSRTISEESIVSYSTEVGQETTILKLEGGEKLWFKFETGLKSGVSLSKE